MIQARHLPSTIVGCLFLSVAALASCQCEVPKNRGPRGFRGLDGTPGSGTGGLIPFAGGKAGALSETWPPGVDDRFFFTGFAETQETDIADLNALIWARNALIAPFDLTLSQLYVTVTMTAAGAGASPLTYAFTVYKGGPDATSLLPTSITASVTFPTVTIATAVATGSNLVDTTGLAAGDRFTLGYQVTNSNGAPVGATFSVNAGLAYRPP